MSGQLLSTDPVAGKRRPDVSVEVKASDGTVGETIRGAVADAGRGWFNTVNPWPALKAFSEVTEDEWNKAKQAAEAGDYTTAVLRTINAHPVTGVGRMLTGIGKSHWDQLVKAYDAGKKGQFSEAIGHATAAFVPVLGPAAADTAERVGAGDISIAEGVGEAAGFVTPFGLKYAKEVAQTRSAIPTAAKVAAAPPQRVGIPSLAWNRNPAERAAVQFGMEKDIPIDAATATGNRFVRGAQAITEHTTPVGAEVASRAKHRQATALTRVGEELSGRANARLQNGQIVPGPAVTPEQAGAGVRAAIDKVATDLATKANTAYDKFRSLAADPAHARPVTRMESARVAGGKDTFAVTLSEPMAMPVDLRGAKAAMKPIYDDIVARWPIARQQASPGLKALENLVNDADYAPAIRVEANLSAAKALAREHGGAAKLAVRELEDAVERAVTDASPQAMKALREGRMATRAKYDALGVLDQLSGEPVQAFRQATYAKDAGIVRLREIEKIAGPAAMRDIGRAWLEDALSLATQEGGFSHGARLWSDWNKVGPQTKTTLFRNKALVRDLDDFFMLAKKIGENPNPSGSALVGSINATGVMLLHPATGIPYVIGSSALSVLLHSQPFVRALTRGMRVPVGNQAAKSAAMTEILNLAGDAASPVATVAEVPEETPATRVQR